MIGCFVVDREALWGEECWLEVEGIVKLRLGSIDLFIDRGDLGTGTSRRMASSSS
jgi:hypothetical protein